MTHELCDHIAELVCEALCEVAGSLWLSVEPEYSTPRRPSARLLLRDAEGRQLVITIADPTEVPSPGRSRTTPMILDVPGIAAELGVTPKTVYNHVKDWPFMTRLPGSRLWRAHRDALRKAVQKGLVP